MKAVIVDINRIYAAALSDDGCIKKVVNKNYAIGQVIELKEFFSFKTNKLAKISSIAAAFLIVCGAGAFSYLNPSTYVSLDVNPSIEYSLNMYDRVIAVKGINDDGTEIISELSLDNLSNKTINEAIALTVEEITKQGYFDGDIAGEMVITTSAKDLKKAAELADELKDISKKSLEKSNHNVNVMAEGVGKERVAAAKELGITPGKLNLIEKLQKSSSSPDSINVDEWKDKSVKDIQKATKANKIINSLTAEQLELITPALETFKIEIGVAGKAFNTAFDVIKTDYTQKINAARIEYLVPEVLGTKLDELQELMLTERRIQFDALDTAIETAKTNFMKATSTLEIDNNLLKNYVEYVVDQEIEIKEGFKDFCKMFELDDDNDDSESKAEESKNPNNNGKNKDKNDKTNVSNTDDTDESEAIKIEGSETEEIDSFAADTDDESKIEDESKPDTAKNNKKDTNGKSDKNK